MFTSNWNHKDVLYMVSRLTSIVPRNLLWAWPTRSMFAAAATAEQACAADVQVCAEAERPAMEGRREHAYARPNSPKEGRLNVPVRAPVQNIRA